MVTTSSKHYGLPDPSKTTEKITQSLLPRKVLVIEDDRDIAHLVQLHLRDAAYEVDVVYDGSEGLERAISTPYDLVILDLTLPGTEGLEVCRRLRGLPDYPLILMLTSRTSELDRVLGLEVGADDYLSKPFSIRELVARVKALFRRKEALGTPSTPGLPEHRIIRTGDLTIDAERRLVTRGAEEIHLTAKEFDLLLLLAHNVGRVYSRAQLLTLVWGYAYEGYEHTVNSHINRLRTKIEKDSAHPDYILTVWGVGYKFMEARG